MTNFTSDKSGQVCCLNTRITGDIAGDWITHVMPASVRIISDTVDRAVRRVVVGVAIQLVSQRQTAYTQTQQLVIK